ncbi:hypothetical protein HGI09_46020 [Streptomyces collinus]|nr:hypothetical protein HGI10_18090 [Streptomyces collinus]UJA17227.1 hypothetical protein HGI09_46020 [Streptomyces collinus]
MTSQVPALGRPAVNRRATPARAARYDPRPVDGPPFRIRTLAPHRARVRAHVRTRVKRHDGRNDGGPRHA